MALAAIEQSALSYLLEMPHTVVYAPAHEPSTRLSATVRLDSGPLAISSDLIAFRSPSSYRLTTD